MSLALTLTADPTGADGRGKIYIPVDITGLGTYSTGGYDIKTLLHAGFTGTSLASIVGNNLTIYDVIPSDPIGGGYFMQYKASTGKLLMYNIASGVLAELGSVDLSTTPGTIHAYLVVG